MYIYLINNKIFNNEHQFSILVNMISLSSIQIQINSQVISQSLIFGIKIETVSPISALISSTGRLIKV